MTSINAARILPTILFLIATHAAAQSTNNPQRPSDADATKAKKVYACPPCPFDCHKKEYSQPGRCPHPDCGMELVDRSTVRFVAIVVWQGAEILDFAGPSEVFASTHIDRKEKFLCYIVGITLKPITSQGFIQITPEFSIENCPRPDIIVLPGGGTSRALTSPELIAWVKRSAETSEINMSVCTGALVLASAGLLDGKEATTYHSAIDGLRVLAPHTVVHDDQRWVDNGNVVTAAGVSAGIDGALHVVSRLHGKKIAQQTADYMEYDWRPQEVTGRIVRPDSPRKFTPKQRIAQTLLDSGLDAALSARRRLLDMQAEDSLPTESQINSLGYRYLMNGDTDTAIRIFTFNVKTHPDGFNAYDSLAEAYMAADQDERSIRNYRKSLELNPKNANAVTMLKKLGAE